MENKKNRASHALVRSNASRCIRIPKPSIQQEKNRLEKVIMPKAKKRAYSVISKQKKILEEMTSAKEQFLKTTNMVRDF